VKDPRPGDVAPTNRDGNQQINYFGERYGWVVALLFGFLALIAALWMVSDVRGMRGDLENIRVLIEGSAAAASQSAVNAALAAERADKAERSAAINREYAVQVFPQLNRMGFPVRTPGEVDHYVAQPEDYARLEAFRHQQEHKP
jgi:hypothetical protein